MPPKRAIEWIPDLAAECWRELEAESLWRYAYNNLRPVGLGDRRLLGEQGLKWRDLAMRGDGETHPDLRAAFVDSQSMKDPTRRATGFFVLLLALDRAAAGLATGTYQPSVRYLLDRWRKKGNLAADSSLLVLRKAATGYQGGASVDQFLQNYTVVDPSGYDLQVHHLESYQVPFNDLPKTAIKVAFVPVLEKDEDAQFVRNKHRKEFRVKLDHGRQALLAGEVGKLIERLEDDRVNVALLPEACADVGLVDALTRALAANYERQLPSTPSLRLVIVGIGGDGSAIRRQHFNDAWVLSGRGEIVCKQTKFHPWQLDAKQADRYRLGQSMAGCIEDIDLEVPPALHLIEDRVIGRLIILICEDIARFNVSRTSAVAVGPSIVVGPVMDDSLEERSWAFGAADQLARTEPGALVLVTNSCWLSRRSGNRGRLYRSSRKRPKDPGVGLVHDGKTPRILRFSSADYDRGFVSYNVDVTRGLSSRRRL